VTDVIGGVKEVVTLDKVMRGTAVHARMILESCLVTADRMAGVEGIHERLFMESLIASVRHDQMQESPSSLGYNYDKSDRMDRGYDHHDWQNTGVTYNGS
jgi:hypothetical protein|tara:strand:- start:92 stop:391 length:300 start_codon:yes stop_codon:yes gene_type:complete